MISVVMCTYNGAAFIKQQLESILTQTLRPDELLIQDDGSKDKTIAIIETFAKTAPFPIHLKVNEQKSLVENGA